jgi:hypothetical protein
MGKFGNPQFRPQMAKGAGFRNFDNPSLSFRISYTIASRLWGEPVPLCNSQARQIVLKGASILHAR